MQVKGRCTFGRTRQFTAADNADRLGLLASNSHFPLGGYKLSKVHLSGVCDCCKTVKLQDFQGSR